MSGYKNRYLQVCIGTVFYQKTKQCILYLPVLAQYDYTHTPAPALYLRRHHLALFRSRSRAPRINIYPGKVLHTLRFCG